MNKVLLSMVVALVCVVICQLSFNDNNGLTALSDQGEMATKLAAPVTDAQLSINSRTVANPLTASASKLEHDTSTAEPADLIAHQETQFIRTVLRNGSPRFYLSVSKLNALKYDELVSVMDDIEAVSTNEAIEYTMQYSEFFFDKTKQHQAGVSVDRLSCGEQLCIALFNYHEKDSIRAFFNSLRDGQHTLNAKASMLITSEKQGYSEQQKFAVLFSTAGSKITGFSQSKS